MEILDFYLGRLVQCKCMRAPDKKHIKGPGHKNA